MSVTTNGAALLAAATATIPLLREQAPVIERERRLTDEVVAALDDAGAFTLSRPARFGGAEADLQTQFDVLTAVARGDGSAGWVASLYSVCGFFAGIFDDRAQEEVFANPRARVAGVFSPTGVLRPVEGGYRLTGRWSWNTGCLHAHWDTLAAIVEGDDGPPEPQICLVPMEDLTVEDDWDPSGLAGTGSNSVRADDVFVPAHRTLSTVAALQGRYASEANRERPLFRTAFFPFVVAASAGTPVGIAQGAMDVFLERLPGRTITYTHYVDQAQAPITHLQAADAAVRTRAAGLLARDVARVLDEAAQAGRELTVPERAAIRGEVGHVVRECRAATEALADASGASSIQRSVPIQRIVRDVRALSIHAALNTTTNLEVHGRVLVGADPQTPFL
jgi:3-hydroxy-9,10-secoandrosta-1,3,5(10)-triene-9,17-dione monooxygenase